MTQNAINKCTERMSDEKNKTLTVNSNANWIVNQEKIVKTTVTCKLYQINERLIKVNLQIKSD